MTWWSDLHMFVHWFGTPSQNPSHWGHERPGGAVPGFCTGDEFNWILSIFMATPQKNQNNYLHITTSLSWYEFITIFLGVLEPRWGSQIKHTGSDGILSSETRVSTSKNGDVTNSNRCPLINKAVLENISIPWLDLAKLAKGSICKTYAGLYPILYSLQLQEVL